MSLFPDHGNESMWLDYTIPTGSYGGVDERFKRTSRKKKQPVGFAPPKPPRSKTPTKRKR